MQVQRSDGQRWALGSRARQLLPFPLGVNTPGLAQELRGQAANTGCREHTERGAGARKSAFSFCTVQRFWGEDTRVL